MTSAPRLHLDDVTHNALDTPASWTTTDQLLARIERRLRAQGATFDDIDERIITELGISASDWHGYHAVRHAADRYQHTRHRKVQDEGALFD